MRKDWDVHGQGHAIQTYAQNRHRLPNSFGFETHTYQLAYAGLVAAHSSVTNVLEALIAGYRKYRRPLSPEEKHIRRIRRLMAGTPPYTHHQLMNHGKRGIQKSP